MTSHPTPIPTPTLTLLPPHPYSHPHRHPPPPTPPPSHTHPHTTPTPTRHHNPPHPITSGGHWHDAVGMFRRGRGVVGGLRGNNQATSARAGALQSQHLDGSSPPTPLLASGLCASSEVSSRADSLWNDSLQLSSGVARATSEFLSASPPPTCSGSIILGEGDDIVLGGSATTGCGVSLAELLESIKLVTGEAVDADVPLMDAGVDSLGAVELRNLLQGKTGVQVPSTVMFDHPTARSLQNALEPKTMSNGRTVGGPKTISATDGVNASAVVALLGSSVQLPSALRVGRTVDGACNAVCEVPATRWDVHAQPALPEPAASRVRHGGFVLGAELADNTAFGLSSAETAAMDPCQRLLLERSYAALHAASLDRAALSGSLTGVFLGFAGTEFSQLLAASPAGGSVYAATGSSSSIASGRVSYVLGLHGPCVSYDTACSAALVACHAGLRALQSIECMSSLIAGVTLMLAPGVGTTFAVVGMTSARGRCHTFDARADGYARGEACGALTLGAAEVEGLSVGGAAVRQDGRSASLTAPNGQAQQGLLVASLQNAATTAEVLTLCEAHGTGTALGDPIETRSLVEAVISQRSASEAPLAVGGVKANIGHAEPAAGMTGLLKLAFGLRCSQAAPNAQLRTLNSHLSEAVRGVACALPVQVAWGAPLGGDRGSGGVSSFGYSGTIAHAVLLCTSFDTSTTQTQAALKYRRHVFPWRVSVASSTSVERAASYARCFVLASPSNAMTSSPCLLLTTRSLAPILQTHAASLPWRVVALLLSDDVVAPSQHGGQAALALAQQLARQARPLELHLLTRGAFTPSMACAASGAAHGGALGFARVLRLEHPALGMQSADVSRGSTLAALLGGRPTEAEVAWTNTGLQSLVRLRLCTAISKRSRAQPLAASAHVKRGVYAITLDHGGFAMRAAALLLRGSATGVLLVSQSSRLVREAQRFLPQWALQRKATRVVASDLAGRCDAAALLSAHPPVGVIHAAGVPKDRLCSSIPGDLHASFAGKALAASHLSSAVVRTPLQVSK